MRRIGVLQVPDWSVVVARANGALPGMVPVATAAQHRIVACDALARASGVLVGQRVRDAQAGAPELVLADADPVGEHHAFAQVLRAVEQVVPGVQSLRPGLLAFPLRGAARFYGGERAALDAIAAGLVGHGFACRFGVADDRFTAELAERATSTEQPVCIVEPGASAAFLARLPVDALGGQLPGMLARLGIHTLGDFAALPESNVRDRFGAEGQRELLRARGLDDRRIEPGESGAPEELAFAFEPGIEGVEELGWAIREAVERAVADLAERRLVCAQVRILLRAETGGMVERVWSQTGFLRASDIVERAKWQLAESGLDSALVEVRIVPERLDRDAHHMPGLWGGSGGIDERTRGVIERLQGMLGREAVLTASLGGGRLLAERGVLTPWGDAAPSTVPGSAALDVFGASAGAAPWPGALPEPRPATVFRPPSPVTLLDGDGIPVVPDERIRTPVWFRSPSGQQRTVAGWAGPWPLRLRAAGVVSLLARLQVVDAAGDGWVLLGDATGWRAEGRYD